MLLFSTSSSLSLLTLTRRFDIFPEFCVFIYTYCLPSFPYVVYERDEFTVVEELGGWMRDLARI